MKLSSANWNRPAPRWYRKFKKIFSNCENFILAILMIKGHAADAPLLLIIKLSTSFILNNLDTLLANGEEYKTETDEKQ